VPIDSVSSRHSGDVEAKIVVVGIGIGGEYPTGSVAVSPSLDVKIDELISRLPKVPKMQEVRSLSLLHSKLMGSQKASSTTSLHPRCVNYLLLAGLFIPIYPLSQHC
jgi:hypothetical protein